MLGVSPTIKSTYSYTPLMEALGCASQNIAWVRNADGGLYYFAHLKFIQVLAKLWSTAATQWTNAPFSAVLLS